MIAQIESYLSRVTLKTFEIVKNNLTIQTIASVLVHCLCLQHLRGHEQVDCCVVGDRLCSITGTEWSTRSHTALCGPAAGPSAGDRSYCQDSHEQSKTSALYRLSRTPGLYQDAYNRPLDLFRNIRLLAV